MEFSSEIELDKPLQDLETFQSLEELPAWNFFKARENNDLRYLYKLDNYFKMDGVPQDQEILDELWERLFDEYCDKFSFTKEFLNIVHLRRDIAIAEGELAITEDRFVKNKIRRLKRQLDELLEPNEDGKALSFEEQVIQIENWRKIPIDSMKITCIRFFTIREQLNQEARKQKISNTMKHG